MKRVILAVMFTMLFASTPAFAGTMFRLGVATPTDHPHSISARKFAELAKEYSNGEITIKVFDNSKLGSNPEIADGVKTGIIDLMVNTPGVMANFGPLPGILELPYIFSDKAHMMKVTRGDIGKDIADSYAKDTGILIIGYFGGAQRNMIFTKAVMNSIDDLKGLKMRTWEWNVMLDWWKGLGAIPAVVSFPEVYTALQTGVIDGAENEFTTFTVARWAEVCKSIALTQHSITVRPLAINKAKFDSLSPELQAALVKAAKDAADFDVELEGELDIKNMQSLKDKFGVKFTSPDKAPLIAKSIAVIKAFAKEKGIEDISQRIIDASK